MLSLKAYILSIRCGSGGLYRQSLKSVLSVGPEMNQQSLKLVWVHGMNQQSLKSSTHCVSIDEPTVTEVSVGPRDEPTVTEVSVCP